MKKSRKRRIENSSYKGITLVALVVTIIVLLILAGVAISLSIGNNGLFTRAENAADTWKKAEINEQEEIKNFEDLYDETTKKLGLDGNKADNKNETSGENQGGNENDTKKKIEEITGNELENTDTVDKNGNRVVVPAGFKVINPEATVNDGIIIEDVKANNRDTVGNQFVWIACTIDGANESIKYDRYAFTRENPAWIIKQSKILGTNGEYEKDADGSYKIVREDNKTYYYHEAMTEEERTSIEEYGGFYIGRYEIGVDSQRSETSKGNIIASRQNKSKFTSI